MHYIVEDDIAWIFAYINRHFTNKESAPDYENESLGLEKYHSTLEQIKNDLYYPTFFEKASFLIVSIAKGHFFSNGNKRLSVMTLILFSNLNSYTFNTTKSLEDMRKLLKNAFPTYLQEEIENFDPIQFMYYNLPLAIVQFSKENNDFDLLKKNVELILKQTLK